MGNFYRDGHLYTLEELQTYDHDFTSFATGIIIPHRLYDIVLNVEYIQLGTSHDTSEFACDSLRYWWSTYGHERYPQATSMLVLCDGGGSNSARYYIFKQDLQALADEIADALEVSRRTVLRDWTFARARVFQLFEVANDNAPHRDAP